MRFRTLGDDSEFLAVRDWWVSEASELRTGRNVWGPGASDFLDSYAPIGILDDSGLELGTEREWLVRRH